MSLLSLRAGLKPTQWATETATRIAEILVGDVAHQESSQHLIERAANVLDGERAMLFEEIIEFVSKQNNNITRFAVAKIMERTDIL